MEFYSRCRLIMIFFWRWLFILISAFMPVSVSMCHGLSVILYGVTAISPSYLTPVVSRVYLQFLIIYKALWCRGYTELVLYIANNVGTAWLCLLFKC